MNEPQVKMVEEATLSSQSFKRLSELREEHEKTIQERKDFEIKTQAVEKDLRTTIDDYQKQVVELVAKEIKQEDLDRREKEIQVLERALELNKAKFEVEVKHQATRAETAIDLFKTVFANVTLRRGINQTISKSDEHYTPGHSGENGSWVSDQTNRNTISETNNREETETES